LPAPEGVGLGTTVQLVPFQCSANVFEVAPVAGWLTALQFVLLEHDTPMSSASAAIAGPGTTFQLVPFQRSISVSRANVWLEMKPPTAVQSVVVGHDTESSSTMKAPAGLGLERHQLDVRSQRARDAPNSAPLASVASRGDNLPCLLAAAIGAGAAPTAVVPKGTITAGTAAGATAIAAAIGGRRSPDRRTTSLPPQVPKPHSPIQESTRSHAAITPATFGPGIRHSAKRDE